MTRIVVVLLVIAGLLLAGCYFVAQKAVEQATGVQVDKRGESVTIKGKEGEQIVIGSQIPDELKNFPAPQGFKPEGGGSFAAGGDKLASATWKGKGTSDAVLAFYAKEMASQGWKEELAIAAGAGAQRHYSKGDSSVIISVAQEGDQVAITVVLGKSGQTPQPAAKSATSVPAAAKPTAPPATTGAQPTAPPPKPQAAPTPAGPPLVDASALPAELKDIPIPSGFGVIKDKVVRLAMGGQFNSAAAAFFGTTAPDKVAEFYKQALPPKGWKEEMFMTTGEGGMGNYVNAKDSTLVLNLVITKTSEGTEVLVTMVKQ